MQMLALKSTWSDLPRMWVTLRAADTEAMLAREQTVFAHGPTVRSVKNLLRNLCVCVAVMRRYRPDVILSTGGGLTVPIFLVGKLMGARLVYVESITRIDAPSLSGKLVYPLTDRFFVQWPAAATRRRMEFVGSLL